MKNEGMSLKTLRLILPIRFLSAILRGTLCEKAAAGPPDICRDR